MQKYLAEFDANGVENVTVDDRLSEAQRTALRRSHYIVLKRSAGADGFAPGTVKMANTKI